MTKCVVLWGSRDHATIISIANGVEEILHVESPAKGSVGEKRPQHPGEHYRQVILAIGDAQEIFIFGPAQAKMELKSAILRVETLARKVAGTETADTMTESDLIARAREMCRSRDISER